MSTAGKRIAGSFLVGIGLIAAAFLFGQYQTPKTTDEGLTVVTKSVSNRNYIAVSDTDKNGIPDWQEALQRTEPVTIEPVDETYETPDTLTDQFAIDFFQSMVRAENNGPFGSNAEELAEQAVADFNTIAQDKLYTTNDIQILKDADAEFKRQYANALLKSIYQPVIPEGTLSELEILMRAQQTNDPNFLNELDIYIRTYSAMRDMVLSLVVPSSYTKEHLDFINALNAVVKDTEGFKMAFADPLYTMVRLKRHQEDQAGLLQTMINLNEAIMAESLPFQSDDYAFIFLTGQNQP